MDNDNRLNLSVSAVLLPHFFQLLEQGVILTAPLGCSVRDFICRHLDVDPRYLSDRIQTIFLDQKPVDDLDTALIRSQSVLALSAAMPGLAGATMRKGGRFAAMRQGISCDAVSDRPSGQRTPVMVKYFNMVAKELGKTRFEKGARIRAANLKWFFTKYPDTLTAGIHTARLDDKKIDPQQLAGISWRPFMFLQIIADQN